MPNFATATIVGHLGADAELKHVGQHDVLEFRLAVSTGFGEKKQTTWWRCAMWGQRGAKISQYLQKGKPILATGEPSLREYQTPTGAKGASLELRVSDVTLLGDGGQRDGGAPAQASNDADVPF